MLSLNLFGKTIHSPLALDPSLYSSDFWLASPEFLLFFFLG